MIKQPRNHVTFCLLVLRMKKTDDFCRRFEKKTKIIYLSGQKVEVSIAALNEGRRLFSRIDTIHQRTE